MGGWRIPIQAMPALKGWAVQYVSGMGPDVEQGSWLSYWRTNAARNEATFLFEPGLPHMCYNEEEEANAVARAFRQVAEIETRVVKI